MPDGHFDALPEGFSGPGLTRSGKFVDVEILGGLTVGGSITGGTITGGTITGGAISGGTITGTTISGGTVIAADIYSDNWNGTIPLALPDAVATLGYALDADTGIIQAQDIRAEGGTLVDLTINGTLTFGNDGQLVTAAAAPRWAFGNFAYSSQDALVFESGDAAELYPGRLNAGITSRKASISLNGPKLGTGTLTDDGGANLNLSSDFTNELADVDLNAYGTDAWDVTIRIGALALGTGTAKITLTAADGVIVSSGQVQTPDGSASAPTYSFSASGQQDVGMYRAGTDIIGFAAGGLNTVSVTTVGIRVADGGVSLPSVTFLNDTDTGMYRVADDQIGFTTGGGSRLRIADTVVICAAPLFRLPVKATTGDPTATDEGDMYVNTFDNAVRVYADAAWRNVTTW